MGVRLSDGDISDVEEDASGYYRCIWPSRTSQEGFEGANCYGPPGNECSERDWVNADRWARPAAPYTSAVQECQFYGASIPTLAEITPLIISGEGLPATDKWVFVTEPLSWTDDTTRRGIGAVKWTSAPQEGWSFLGTSNGQLVEGLEPQQFICVGKRPQLTGFLPSNSSCQSSCVTVVSGRVTL